MSVSELVDWIAFFKVEQEEQERAQQRARDKAEADKLLRQMSGRGF